jgi:hypothetical protein
MSEISVHFVVGNSFRLPGLGLLVLPVVPAPSWLTDYDLHTALAITVPLGTQPFQSTIGTVEEIARDGQLKQRALLLDVDPNISIVSGTRLQAAEIRSDFL